MNSLCMRLLTSNGLRQLLRAQVYKRFEVVVRYDFWFRFSVRCFLNPTKSPNIIRLKMMEDILLGRIVALLLNNLPKIKLKI